MILTDSPNEFLAIAPLSRLPQTKAAPIPIEPARLRFAKAVRVSIDGNAAFCRGLLHTRYPNIADEEVRP